MERAIIRLSVANFITVGLLASAAYFGVVGAQMVTKKVKAAKMVAAGGASTGG